MKIKLNTPNRSVKDIHNLETKLTDVINTLFKAAQTTIDYSTSEHHQKLLTQRLEKVVDILAELDKLADHVDLNIPVSHINTINQGNSPLEILNESQKVLIDRNQKTNGRIKSMKLLKDEVKKVM